MEEFLAEVQKALGTDFLVLIKALAVLALGWVVATIAGRVVFALFNKTSLQKRLAKWTGKEGEEEAVPINRYVSRGAFWLVMLFVLIAFFQTMGLTIVAGPLNALLTSLLAFAPRLLAAAILAGTAWLLARVLRVIVTKALEATRFDTKLSEAEGDAESSTIPLSKTAGQAVYWLVFLLFLPAVLTALALEGLLVPVRNMLDQLLVYLPNLLAAGAILALGWIVGRIVRRVVTKLAEALGADGLAVRVSLNKVLGRQKLSEVLGHIIFAIILVPVIIASLNALKLEALTRPASNMLDQMLSAVPGILAAVLIVTLAYVVGRVLATLATKVLWGTGFDRLPQTLGLATPDKTVSPKPSEIVGYVIVGLFLVFGGVEAARLMNLTILADQVTLVIGFAGNVGVGLVVLGIGLWLANLAAGAIHASGNPYARLLALVARVSIVALSAAMALNHMGLGETIITLAFGLILGSIAVAAAIAFGIGGREIAARELEGWLKSARGDG